MKPIINGSNHAEPIFKRGKDLVLWIGAQGAGAFNWTTPFHRNFLVADCVREANSYSYKQGHA